MAELIRIFRKRQLYDYIPLGKSSIDNLIAEGKLKAIPLGVRAVGFTEANVIEIQQECLAAAEARSAAKAARGRRA